MSERALRRILTHRHSRLLIPPLGLALLIATLTVPLLKDLRRLGEDDLYVVGKVRGQAPHAGSLIVNIKDVNPNNGIATLDLSYITEEGDQGKIELWLASGGVTSEDNGFTYDVSTELRRVPVVMDTPTVFVWKAQKRAVYKQADIAVKIDDRTPGYFYPFDRYIVEFSFSVIDKDQKSLSPALWFELSDPRFVHTVARQMTTDDDRAVAVPESLHVKLDRPTYQKIFLGLTLLMGLASVLWSLFKITYTSVDSMESLSLLAFNFTILLAVPGLRGVFVPSNLQFAPLFDFFVVLIWTVGLLSLFVTIVKHDVVVRLRRRRASAVREERPPGSLAGQLDGEATDPGPLPTLDAQ
jgi:hypothetical protein